MIGKVVRKVGKRIVGRIGILLMILGLLSIAPGKYTQDCEYVTGYPEISFNQWVKDSTTRNNRVLRYSFYGTARSRVSIWMERDDYSSIDPYLQLEDGYGYVVASDDDSAGNSNSWIDRQYLRSSGCYTIVARSYNNRTYGSFWLYVSKY